MANINNIPTEHRSKIATGTALLFHGIGFCGIVWGNRELFISSTPFNLLLMMVLLLWVQQKIDGKLIGFLSICFVTGMVTEMIGVNTGRLFGHYHYGNALGIAVWNVPLMIGVNWFVVMFSCGAAMQQLSDSLLKKTGGEQLLGENIMRWSRIVDAALLAVFFDWIMEPAAIKLGYWQWAGDGSIPFFNYASWFGISLLLQFFYGRLITGAGNKFAVHLLFIQALFFMAIRSVL